MKGLLKLLKDKNITLEYDDAASGYLAELGYDPVYGARPLKRIIQKYVQNGLADKILRGAFADGDHIKLSYDGPDLTMEKT